MMENNVASMTGYGRAELKTQTHRYTIETKSVNSRFIEIKIQGVKSDLGLEFEMEKQIKKKFMRGKFDVSVRVEDLGKKAGQFFDPVVVEKVWKEIEKIRKQLHIDAQIPLQTAFSMASQATHAQFDGSVHAPFLLEVLQQSLENVEQSRIREGKVMIKDIRKRSKELEKYVGILQKQSRISMKEKIEQGQKRISEMMGEHLIDPHRVYQEVVVHAERSDVSEEITRLKSHFVRLTQLVQLPSQTKSVGRELDFMVQEIHREINTVGSKVHDSELNQLVVQMKMELEKIREQIQNLE
ncbi:MAG: YicC/YloC family endoribonuclease [Bdellovibrionota bacterium]